MARLSRLCLNAAALTPPLGVAITRLPFSLLGNGDAGI